MKLSAVRFNIILAVAVLLIGAGCKTSEEKKKAREATFMRFHLETNVDGTPHNSAVVIYRAHPMKVGVERNATLDEEMMEKAELVTVDEFGSRGIKITFDDAGRKRLDYVTSSYKGRRLAIQARWTETRWLAAPLITKRISDGIFIFTPDASPDECERIVHGLNNVIAKLKKPYTLI